MDNKTIYENFNWSSLSEKHLIDKTTKVLEIIPDDVKTILDIGCGNGAITNILGRKFDVTGVDRSKTALEMVTTSKIRTSSDKIPLPDQSFDMIFSSELLEHLERDVLEGTIAQFKRLSKKYIFITVPNAENPDKLLIKCPDCGYIYNSPNHLRSFSLNDFTKLFPEYEILETLTFGKLVRYYNRNLLITKKTISPSKSWIPYYWIPKNKRETTCPKCEHEFYNSYHFNLFATFIDILNVIISPKKPYWLFVLLRKNK